MDLAKSYLLFLTPQILKEMSKLRRNQIVYGRLPGGISLYWINQQYAGGCVRE